ncbi:MAG: hypothetical protein WCV85_01905 [Patescibacteria group bacterium]|jgi:hypothetical protein
MSKRRHAKAKLQKFDGPFFPPIIEKFNEKLADPNRALLNQDDLRIRCKRLPHYRGTASTIMDIPLGLTTSDGYYWFATFWFETGILFWKRTVLVLMPWSQDWDNIDGSQCDRSAAIYTSGNPKPEFIEYAIQAVMKML